MYTSGQLSLLLLLFITLVCICDAAVVLTATVASDEFRQSPKIASQMKLDLHNNVPYQRVVVGDSVILQLDSERTVEGALTAVTSFSSDNYVLSGRVGNGGEFYLSFSSGIAIGHVEFAEELLRYDILPDPDPTRDNGYLVRSVPSSVYEKEDFPESLLPREMREEAGEERYRAIISAQSHASLNVGRNNIHNNEITAATADTNNIIDVMFLFTPQALVAIGGGQHSMDAMAIYSVQLANDAYANSNVPLRMRSVGVFLVRDAAYKEGGFQDELNRLRYTDGILDEDVAQRTALGADSVVLFVASSSYCGLAYQWASAELTYAVVSTQCPSSVVHEVGHNIGCQHDRSTEHSVDMKDYKFGYCWDTSGSTCSRSVMAYPGCVTTGKRTNCPRVAYFSSPLITYGALGRTTGIATSDNARVLREQASRATNWALSKRDGGLIFSVQPSAVAVSRCEPVTITGWRIGTTGSDIVNVTINGVPIQRIMSQSLDSVQVLAGPGSTPGIGDIVVTTRSGYTTTLAKGFAYEATSGLFHSDFESGMGPFWSSSGALGWTIVRYCNSLPCAKAPAAGTSVGAGGSGSFAKLVASESSSETGSLTALFNQNSRNHGCVESVHSISLAYHLWNPIAAQCGGWLTVSMQSVSSSAWTTILTAETRQANQDDPWLPLSYTFPDPSDVSAIRITADPYTGMSMCYKLSSVSVDQIVVNKTTACAQDGCDLKTNYPTVLPTLAPSVKPTIAPTSVSPTKAPTFAPTFTLIKVVEQVQFTSTLNFTGITAAQFQSEANSAVLFLRTVATTLGLAESSLCCVLVADLPESPVNVTRRALSTVAKRMSISYTTKLLMERIDQSNTVSGEENAPSSQAASVFDQTVLLLTQSVASGSLQQALSAALPSSWASALAVEPVLPSSFSSPRSFVSAATNPPTPAPTSFTAPASLGGGGGGKKGGWTGWSLYVGIVAIILTALGSVYGLYVYSQKSDDSSDAGGENFANIINGNTPAASRDEWEVPNTPSSSMRNAERSRKDSYSNEDSGSIRNVPGGAWVVPPSPSRQQSGFLPPPSQAYMESLYTPRGSRMNGPHLVPMGSLMGSTASTPRYQYQQVSTVNMDESRHQAPYQDIIDSVNRTSSRDYYDPSAPPPSSSWYAPALHDPYAGADGPYNAPMISIHRTPRAPANTPAHGGALRGEGVEMVPTPRGSMTGALARTPSLHLQYGCPRAMAGTPERPMMRMTEDAIGRARSGTEDAAPLPARMPRVAGLPFPPSITINTKSTGVPPPATATGWTPRGDTNALRPETGFSSGVARVNTPHSVPFMHPQLHQQHQVNNTPRGVASREGTPRNSNYQLAVTAPVVAAPPPANPNFPPALSVNTNAAPIVLRQQRVVPRAYSEKFQSEGRTEGERNAPRAYSEKIRSDAGLEGEGHVSGLIRQFSGKSSGGTPTYASTRAPARLSGAATTTALEVRERMSEKRPSLQFPNMTEGKGPEQADLPVLTHAQLLAGRLESPIAVAGFSPSAVNNNNNVSTSGKKEATSIKSSGLRSIA